MYQISLYGVSGYHMDIAFIYHGFLKPYSVRCEIFQRVVTHGGGVVKWKQSGWPLVGNEGIYMVMMGIHSLIPC